MTDARLIKMALLAARDGVPGDLLDDLKRYPPDPDEFDAVVDLALVREGRDAAWVLGLVGLHLVQRDPRFRRATEAAFDRASPVSYTTSLAVVDAELGVDDMRWWSSVVVRNAPLDSNVGLLLTRHGPALLERRGDEVLRLLTEPERGPGRNRVDHFTAALSVVGRQPLLEEIWTRWIGDGLFDKGREEPLHGAGILAMCLQDLIDGSAPAGTALLHTAAEHWRSLVESGDAMERRRVVSDVADILHERFGSDAVRDVVLAITSVVAPALDRSGTAEAGSVGAALRATIEHHRSPLEEEAIKRLWNEVAVMERETPDLPWKPRGPWL